MGTSSNPNRRKVDEGKCLKRASVKSKKQKIDSEKLKEALDYYWKEEDSETGLEFD